MIKSKYELCIKCKGRGTVFIYHPSMYEGCGFIQCDICDGEGSIYNHYTTKRLVLDTKIAVNFSD